MEKKNKKYKNIILYGFMCSGKTTVAKKLAKELKLKFIDTDLIFEKKYGKINKFVEIHGFKEFRKIEKRIFKEVIKEKNAVISAGGGLFPSKLKSSLELFLNPPFNLIEKRFSKNKKTRPLLSKYPKNKKEIFKLYLERLKNYKKAAYEIREKNLKKIVNLIKSYYEKI